MDLLKVRPLTVPETQFMMLQCLEAMQYMHHENVIHRDLKPGNIMLDKNLNVKIGDFGLAAELFYDGERKQTVCGTPNYIAPEIIDRRGHGHSFEVDVWSLGVVLFTLLVGRPPFQMDDIDATYRRIRACRYDLPPSLPELARDLIGKVLQSSPASRPTLLRLRAHAFFAGTPATPPSSLARHGRPPAGAAPPPPSVRSAGGGGAGSPFPPGDAPPPPRALRELHPNKPFVRSQSDGGGGGGGLKRTGKGAPREGLARPFLPPRRGTHGSGAEGDPSPAPPLPERLPRRTASRDGKWGESEREREREAGGNGNGARGREFYRAGHSHRAVSSSTGARGTVGHPRSDTSDELQELTTLHDRLQRTLHINGTDKKEEESEGKEEGEREGRGRQRAVVVDGSGPLPSPQVWVTACADFSAKYGICYRLSTGQIGVYFNDSTKMVWNPDLGQVEYYARVRVEVPQGDGENALYAKDQLETFHIASYPSALEKKITLIKYFTSYLGRARSDGSEKVKVVRCSPYTKPDTLRPSDPHGMKDFVYVKRWLHTAEALVFRLSNQTVQVCFNDGAEIILSSEWKVLTYTDPFGNRRTLALATVANESAEAASRLHYTKTILYRMIKDHCL